MHDIFPQGINITSGTARVILDILVNGSKEAYILKTMLNLDVKSLVEESRAAMPLKCRS